MLTPNSKDGSIPSTSNYLAMSEDYSTMTKSEKQLIFDALNAYKDDDNEEYNVEINQLINKLSS